MFGQIVCLILMKWMRVALSFVFAFFWFNSAGRDGDKKTEKPTVNDKSEITQVSWQRDVLIPQVVGLFGLVAKGHVEQKRRFMLQNVTNIETTHHPLFTVSICE